MKRLHIIAMMVTVVLSLASCERFFLEKPDTTGTVDINAVFSTERNAMALLMSSYRNCLLMDWPGGIGFAHGTLGGISGEVGRGYDWHGTYIISNQGLSVNGCNYSENGADRYSAHWGYIRTCFIIIENIDRVPDLSDEMKECIKAEAKALIAYRYMGMFYRYGGVPIVKKIYDSEDIEGLSIGRGTLQEVVDYICELCDEAAAVLPDTWDSINEGRLTKGAALAIKARTLQFAARPLFNADKPYLDNGPEGNKFICFNGYSEQRWKDAIAANLALLDWADANGHSLLNTGEAGEGAPNPNAFDDYATATSVAGNPEIILPYKCDEWRSDIHTYLLFNMLADSHWETDDAGVLSNHVENYYDENGEDINWPQIGESARPGSDWIDIVEHIEPRAKADIKFCGFDAYNNPGDINWQEAGWIRESGNINKDKLDTWPGALDQSAGCGALTKFYYKAGSRRWCELPLFRTAEFCLGLAEAYNEVGENDKALMYLNMVHNRAGLPSIVETDKEILRKIIQREYYIEFFFEGGKKYYNSKHWKRDDIADGICGGQMEELQFSFMAGSELPLSASKIEWYWKAETFKLAWQPRMFLEPFPQSEINKGFIIQNPGY